MSRLRTQIQDENLVPLSAKVPAEVRTALEQIAQEEERSLSSVVARVLRQDPVLAKIIVEIKKKQETVAA